MLGSCSTWVLFHIHRAEENRGDDKSVWKKVKIDTLQYPVHLSLS